MGVRKFRSYTLEELKDALTISVEEASHFLGISRTATYEAIKRGEIEVIRLGKLIRVLAQPLYRMLIGGQGTSNRVI